MNRAAIELIRAHVVGRSRINLNDYVYFKSRKPGMQLWKEYHNGLAVVREIPDKIQIWEFCAIFGPGMTMGFDPPVETTIEIESVLDAASKLPLAGNDGGEREGR